MIYTALTSKIVLHATTSLVMILVSLVIGIRILSKYFQYKNISLITVGLTWIFLTTPWWGEVISFISFLLFQQIPSDFFFLLIVNALIHVALFSWIYSYSEILKIKNRKVIQYIFLIILIVWDVIIVILLSMDTTLIGIVEHDDFTASQADFIVILQLFALLTITVTGLHFSYKSLKAPDRKTILKGRFLLAAFLLFLIGAGMDAVIDEMTIGILLLTRILLISASISYYFGFFLPEKLVKD
jgi:hypothetical protein